MLRIIGRTEAECDMDLFGARHTDSALDQHDLVAMVYTEPVRSREDRFQ